MGKKFYSQPLIKVFSISVYGDVCEQSLQVSIDATMYGPPTVFEQPLF